MKNNIFHCKQEERRNRKNRETSETDLVESLKSLVSVTRGVLREENGDNVHESDANEDVEGTLKRLYLGIPYSGRTDSTSKSRVPSSKLSLIPSDTWVKRKDRTNRRNIVLDTTNSKSSKKKETDWLSDALHMAYLLLVR